MTDLEDRIVRKKVRGPAQAAPGKSLNSCMTLQRSLEKDCLSIWETLQRGDSKPDLSVL